MKRCACKHCLRKAEYMVNTDELLEHLEECLKREHIPQEYIDKILSAQEIYYAVSSPIRDTRLCVKHLDELIGKEFELDQLFAKQVADALKDMDSTTKDEKKGKKTKTKGKNNGSPKVSVIVIKEGGKK